MTRVRSACVALSTALLVGACEGSTSPQDARLGSRLRTWAFDSTALLASEPVSPLSSATQLVVDDSLSWRALWQAVYADRLPPPPLPLVDFTSHSVLVYGLGAVYARLQLDSITYYELGNAAYLTDTRPGSGCFVAAVVLAPIIVVRAPERVVIQKWHLRDVVQPCN